jgi:hypothetical protein
MPKPENIVGKGFDNRPQNINKNGRPRKLISFINTELKEEGYTPATKDEVSEAYLTMLNLPFSKIKEISDGKNDNYPMLYKLVAKEMLGKRGQEMLEKLLDRAIGKSQQYIDHTTKGEAIRQVEVTIVKDGSDKA